MFNGSKVDIIITEIFLYFSFFGYSQLTNNSTLSLILISKSRTDLEVGITIAQIHLKK